MWHLCEGVNAIPTPLHSNAAGTPMERRWNAGSEYSVFSARSFYHRVLQHLFVVNWSDRHTPACLPRRRREVTFPYWYDPQKTRRILLNSQNFCEFFCEFMFPVRVCSTQRAHVYADLSRTFLRVTFWNMYVLAVQNSPKTVCGSGQTALMEGTRVNSDRALLASEGGGSWGGE